MVRAIPDKNGGGNLNPTAMLREKDAMMKGVLLSKRNVNTTFGSKPVYSFTVLEATCSFVLDKVEVSPEEGAAVDVFAPTRLERQLSQIAVGETVTIKYVGRKQVGKGQPAHIFDVEVQ